MPKPDMTREWCVSNSICELLLDLPVFSIGPSFLLSAEADTLVSTVFSRTHFLWRVGLQNSARAWDKWKGKIWGWPNCSSYKSALSFPGFSPMPHSHCPTFLALLVFEPFGILHHESACCWLITPIWGWAPSKWPVIFHCSSVSHLPRFGQYLWGGLCLSPLSFYVWVCALFPLTFSCHLEGKENRCVCSIHLVSWKVASLLFTKAFYMFQAGLPCI